MLTLINLTFCDILSALSDFCQFCQSTYLVCVCGDAGHPWEPEVYNRDRESRLLHERIQETPQTTVHVDRNVVLLSKLLPIQRNNEYIANMKVREQSDMCLPLYKDPPREKFILKLRSTYTNSFILS